MNCSGLSAQVKLVPRSLEQPQGCREASQEVGRKTVAANGTCKHNAAAANWVYKQSAVVPQLGDPMSNQNALVGQLGDPMSTTVGTEECGMKSAQSECEE